MISIWFSSLDTRGYAFVDSKSWSRLTGLTQLLTVTLSFNAWLCNSPSSLPSDTFQGIIHLLLISISYLRFLKVASTFVSYLAVLLDWSDINFVGKRIWPYKSRYRLIRSFSWINSCKSSYVKSFGISKSLLLWLRCIGCLRVYKYCALDLL